MSATVTAKEVRERPILFSGPMVRAILEGRKTQTRRVMKMKIETAHDGMIRFSETMGGFIAPHVWRGFVRCPYGDTGDRLWVRETFAPLIGGPQEPWNPTMYRADNLPEYERLTWRPSIFMPRWASRITLEITEVRVERLQEISTADIQSEGVLPPDYPHGTYVAEFGWERRLWREGWDNLNAKRGYSWESNPWVWVISFRRVEQEAT